MRFSNRPHIDLRLGRVQRQSLGDAVNTGMQAVQQVTRTLMQRSTSTESSGSTCSAGNDSSICQKPTSSSNTATIAIALGAV